MKKTHPTDNKISPPNFLLEDTADFYVYYVLILSLPSEIFWYSDCSFVKQVADNMAAYNGWRNYIEYKEREKIKRRTSHKR